MKKFNFLWNARVIQFSNETATTKDFLEFQIKNQQNKRERDEVFNREKNHDKKKKKCKKASGKRKRTKKS